MQDYKTCWIHIYLAFTGCISIAAFASLADTLLEIKSSAMGLNICAITGGIKRKKSVIK